MNTPARQAIKRYIAIDVHKRYVVIGGLSVQMEIVLPLRRVHIDRFSQWAEEHLKPFDAVVIEATTNTWTLYDIIAPLVGKAVVANAYQVKLIAAARVKTDKHDVWSLARLLVADLIPEVWVPPVHVRELRALISHRRRLIQIRTRARKRQDAPDRTDHQAGAQGTTLGAGASGLGRSEYPSALEGAVPAIDPPQGC